MASVTIEIKQGKLKGKKNLDIYENEFYSFEGIPYGKPPIGDLRFKPPLPAEPWEGVFDGTIGTKVCPSYLNVLSYPDLVDEDCLRVNVYTPVDLTQKCDNLLPVMVHIHGGAFITGCSIRDELGPDFLMSKNVILVTFNYRLGVLGFFSLNDVSLNVTGNAGCKDMVEALKWIKNNISHFGGDPYNVTIFGESAGAVGVSSLLISRLSRGLFHKAIIQSGSATCPWAFNSISVEEANKSFLGKLKCNTSDPKKILEFLQSKTYAELGDAEYYTFSRVWINNLKVDLHVLIIKKLSRKYFLPVEAVEILSANRLFETYSVLKNNSKRMSAYIQLPNFAPIIEVDHETAFLTEHPEESIKNGSFFKCPTIAGFLNEDGSIVEMLGLAKPNLQDFRYLFPYKVLQDNDSSTLETISKKLQTFYYKNEVPSYENKHIFNKIITDIYFGIPIKKLVQYISLYSSYPTYFYKFFLTSKINKEAGVLKHLDDTRYIFSTKTTKDLVTIGSMEEKAVNLITTLWTNFAKSNNPNPLPNDYHNIEWQPITGSKLNYFHIDHYPRPAEDPDSNRFKYVETLFES